MSSKTTWHSLTSGALRRRYLACARRGSGNEVPVGVIIELHGSGSKPEEQMQVSGMARIAAERGFLVLMPLAAAPYPAGGVAWNVPARPALADDLVFLDDMLDHAGRLARIDTARVFVSGFSGGARLACEYASRSPRRVAALGAVGGLRAPGALDGPAVPVIAFHGVDDPINPYAGGGPDYWLHGVDEAAAAWAARNRCDTRMETLRTGDAVTRQRRRSRDGRADVVVYRIDGAGHTWPGSVFPFPSERFGKVPRKPDATALMLEYFARHGRGSGTERQGALLA